MGLGSGTVSQAAPPKVNYLFPAGVSRGQSVVITASGDFANWPAEAWCDRAGITVVAEKDKGKFRVTAPADVAPGVAWLRFYDAEGASSLRPLVVSAFPEIVEVEPNDTPAKAQKIAGDTVVHGRLQKGGDLDGFQVELKQGETLTAALQAHSLLGSPMDAVAQICRLVPRGESANESTRLEAFVLEQNHDVVGLDPIVAATAPQDGAYLVRVFAYPSEPNSSIAYAGGDNYVYRLTLTKGEFDPASMMPPPVDAPKTVSGRAGDEAQGVEMPSLLLGRLETPGEQHLFSFTASKGKKILFQSQSHEAGLPTEPLLRVLDDKGAVLAEAEGGDPKRELELTFAPPADGAYRLSLRDMFDRGGPWMKYRVAAAVQTPTFKIAVGGDAFVLGDKPLEIPITIDRQAGFNEPIEITAVDLPSGVTCDKVVSEPKGDTAKAIKLALKRSDEAAAGNMAFRVQAKSTGEQALTLAGRFATGLPLDRKHESLWLTVKK
jgi:hypothetical protein